MPEIELHLPLGIPNINSHDQKCLVNYATKYVKCYTQPDQTQTLLDDCKNWGVTLTQQKKFSN